MVEFPVSGIETWWWLPPLVAFLVSSLTSTGGLSGAFLMLPFQVTVLGFAGPGVTPTNLFFNVIGIPSGVYRYAHEKRMLWPLAWAIVIGTVPGMAIGAIVRVTVLPDPVVFKPFAGVVLGYIAFRLLRDALKKNDRAGRLNRSIPFEVSEAKLTLHESRFIFQDKSYSVPTIKLLLLSLLVGIAGGAYGIGGGAVIAPWLVSVWGLPVYTVAGAALFSTFVGSVCGVLFFWLIDVSRLVPGVSAEPDWLLGISLGVGGALGIYVGARLQKYLPAKLIKIFLTAFLLFVAVRYISALFSG